MGKEENYSAVKKFSLGLGLDLFGVADVSGIKKEFRISEKALQGMDRAICLGLGLSESVLQDIEDHPTRLYFHHYRSVNAFLDQAALKAADISAKKVSGPYRFRRRRLLTGKRRRRTSRIRESAFSPA